MGASTSKTSVALEPIAYRRESRLEMIVAAGGGRGGARRGGGGAGRGGAGAARGVGLGAGGQGQPQGEGGGTPSDGGAAGGKEVLRLAGAAARGDWEAVEAELRGLLVGPG
jgi:hypothetical protein